MWHKLRAWQEQAPRSKRSCVITGWRPLVHLDEGTEKSCLPSPQEGAGLGHGTVQTENRRDLPHPEFTEHPEFTAVNPEASKRDMRQCTFPFRCVLTILLLFSSFSSIVKRMFHICVPWIQSDTGPGPDTRTSPSVDRDADAGCTQAWADALLAASFRHLWPQWQPSKETIQQKSVRH